MHQEIIHFWFNELSPADWWKKDEQLDQRIAERFLATHNKARAGELSGWRATAQGALAEVIVLDQFSRNIYRDSPGAFECDGMALLLAQVAIEKGQDVKLAIEQRVFLYLPFMHSESRAMHNEAVRLFTELGRPDNLEFEIKHKEIIERFGRYPHRNDILGRESTPDEIEFLKQPGSSF